MSESKSCEDFDELVIPHTQNLNHRPIKMISRGGIYASI